MLKKYSPFIVTGVLLVVLAVSLVVSSQESTTMDEQAHIPAAYTYVKYNDMRLNPEHPPLFKDLAGFPLLFLDVNFPTDDPAWQQGINEQWQLGNKFIHSNDADAITFWSRVPIILIALLLGFFIFLWTKELAGTTAGLFALILYAADPNILGHNHYVTTDIGIAAFVFISFYFFIKWIKAPTWKNTLLAGIFLALAQLAKFSGVLVFPIFTLVIVLYALAKKKYATDTRSNAKFKTTQFVNYIGKYAVMIIICFAIIWLLYFYNTFNMPAEKIQDVANTVFGDQGMGKLSKSIVIAMSNIPLLKPLGEYFLGLFMVFVRVTGGNTYYFLGSVSNHASKAYFPVVFLIKETLPFLFLILFSSLYFLSQLAKHVYAQQKPKIRNIWNIFTSYLTSGVAQYTMFLFIVLYSYLSITGNLNIGFRHLFPILPFAYVLVTKKLFDFLRSLDSINTKKLFSAILCVFLIWIIAEPIIAFPSYLSYFNEFVGGHKNGYKYVTDSNTDWGQDLKRLRNWIEDYNSCEVIQSSPSCVALQQASNPHKKIKKIRVDYFGGSNPEYYLKDMFIPWHADNTPEAGWYAISAGFLQESIYKQKKPGDKSYVWLTQYEPVARVGDSIFVYYIPESENIK